MIAIMFKIERASSLSRMGQSDYRKIPQDTAGSLDMGVFNGIYHIIKWNRHFRINNSKYLHLFLFLLVNIAMQ